MDFEKLFEEAISEWVVEMQEKGLSVDVMWDWSERIEF